MAQITGPTQTHISNEVRCHVRIKYRGRFIRCWRRAHETLDLDDGPHLVCSMHLELQAKDPATPLIATRLLRNPPKFKTPEPTT